MRGMNKMRISNKKLMEKVIELGTDQTFMRTEKERIMIQIGVICDAFGVKNNEYKHPIEDYEREMVVTEDAIKKEFNRELRWLEVAETHYSHKIEDFKNRIKYFIEAVRFFHPRLADELESLK